jgi:hypothetical protein
MVDRKNTKAGITAHIRAHSEEAKALKQEVGWF